MIMMLLPKHSFGTIVLGLLVIVQVVVSDFEYAVTYESGIRFYDGAWKRVNSVSKDYLVDIEAIAHDSVTDTVFFNDMKHPNGSIFSLQMGKGTEGTVRQLVVKSGEDHIGGIAFDSLERRLYWTDARKMKIFRMSVGSSSEIVPGAVTEWRNMTAMPVGIAIDVCRRKIYWSIVNPAANDAESTIYMAELDGTNVKMINQGHRIYGLAVDQFSGKLFWVDDTQGNGFQVDSSNLDGSQNRTEYRGLNNQPGHVAVDNEFVYWTDSTDKKIFKLAKNNTNHSDCTVVDTFPNAPQGILIRQNFAVTKQTSNECRQVYATIQTKHVEQIKAVAAPSLETASTQTQCSNPTSLCHNYCLRGSCHELAGVAKCVCPAGYSGDRCEVDECFADCFDGLCLFETAKLAPVCQTKICKRFCDSNKPGSKDLVSFCGCGTVHVNTDVPSSGPNNSTEVPISGHSDKLNASTDCPSDSPNKMVLLLSVVIVVSLCLVLLIVLCVRRVYKPLRPRIKKTFVVRNKMDRKNKTPLTCRPVAEQCEITIEDCCNMNICDTPCFDPETMHEEMKKERSRKEDKYNLLTNMDGDLY